MFPDTRLASPENGFFAKGRTERLNWKLERGGRLYNVDQKEKVVHEVNHESRISNFH